MKTDKEVKENELPQLVVYTSNNLKFRELDRLLKHKYSLIREPCKVNEIQHHDGKIVAHQKCLDIYYSVHLQSKYNHLPFIVEDTSFHCEAMNGLPGPLIKHFEEQMGSSAFSDLIRLTNKYDACAKCIIAYCLPNQQISLIHPLAEPSIQLFEGSCEGIIVSYQTIKQTNFGWDTIFQPNGSNVSMACMDTYEKDKISHRKMCIENFLNKQ